MLNSILLILICSMCACGSSENPVDSGGSPQSKAPASPKPSPPAVTPDPQGEALMVDKSLPPQLQTLHEALLAKPEDGHGNLTKFEKWAKLGQWEQFDPEYHHYDWWMFPLKAFTQASSTTKQWAVTDAEVAQLKKSALFMAHYRRAVQLMCLSWGYDIDSGEFIENPSATQKWKNYVIRMDKLGQSLLLFGEDQRFKNLVKFRDHFKIDASQTHWGNR